MIKSDEKVSIQSGHLVYRGLDTKDYEDTDLYPTLKRN